MAQRGFVEPRISTAMTPGGGVAGIGFDGSGLGEGCVALISTHKGNDQGDDKRQDLDRQEDDRTADAASSVLEDRLVVAVALVEVTRRRGLHLPKVSIDAAPSTVVAFSRS
jgi:hypothetical protein